MTIDRIEAPRFPPLSRALHLAFGITTSALLFWSMQAVVVVADVWSQPGFVEVDFSRRLVDTPVKGTSKTGPVRPKRAAERPPVPPIHVELEVPPLAPRIEPEAGRGFEFRVSPNDMVDGARVRSDGPDPYGREARSAGPRRRGGLGAAAVSAGEPLPVRIEF